MDEYGEALIRRAKKELDAVLEEGERTIWWTEFTSETYGKEYVFVIRDFWDYELIDCLGCVYLVLHGTTIEGYKTPPIECGCNIKLYVPYLSFIRALNEMVKKPRLKKGIKYGLSMKLMRTSKKAIAITEFRIVNEEIKQPPPIILDVPREIIEEENSPKQTATFDEEAIKENYDSPNL